MKLNDKHSPSRFFFLRETGKVVGSLPLLSNVHNIKAFTLWTSFDNYAYMPRISHWQCVIWKGLMSEEMNGRDYYFGNVMVSAG